MATSASALILPRLSMSPPMPARASLSTTMARSRTRHLRAACAYALQEGQSRRSHRLPCGLDLEVIAQHPPSPAPIPGRTERPPLVFVHGSFHAAWCWAERWLPFFSSAGFPCIALSLRAQKPKIAIRSRKRNVVRATLEYLKAHPEEDEDIHVGESSIPSEAVAGTLETHTGDIADFIRKEVPTPPVLIGHSFGGLIVQQYISCLQGSESLHPQLSGAVLVCSVPPSGNSGLVWRYLLTKPIAAVKWIDMNINSVIQTLRCIYDHTLTVTLSLAAKAYAKSLPLCKETFFSSQMDDELVLRYQYLMKESSKLPLFDLRKLNASLPVPSVRNGTLEVLVMGASNDFIVDVEGLSETARFYNVQPVCVEGVAHDMMLDCSWEKGAEIILSWLDKLAPQSV